MRLRSVKTNIAAATVLFGSCAALPHVTSTEKTHLSSVIDEDLSQDSAVLDSQITVEDSEQATDEETVPPTDTSTSNKSGYKPSNIVRNFIDNIERINIRHKLGSISENDAVKKAVAICEETHDAIRNAQPQVLTELCEEFEPEIDNPLCKDANSLEISQCLDSEDILGCVKTNVDSTSTKNQPNKAVENFPQSLEGFANCTKKLQEKDTTYVKLVRLYKSIVLQNFEKIMNKTQKTIKDSIIRMRKNAEERKKYLDLLREDLDLLKENRNTVNQDKKNVLKEKLRELLRRNPIRGNTDNKP